MLYHDKYLIHLKVLGQEREFFVAVPHEIPEELIPKVIQEEVELYLKREMRYHYTRILL